MCSHLPSIRVVTSIELLVYVRSSPIKTIQCCVVILPSYQQNNKFNDKLSSYHLTNLSFNLLFMTSCFHFGTYQIVKYITLKNTKVAGTTTSKVKVVNSGTILLLSSQLINTTYVICRTLNSCPQTSYSW